MFSDARISPFIRRQLILSPEFECRSGIRFRGRSRCTPARPYYIKSILLVEIIPHKHNFKECVIIFSTA